MPMKWASDVSWVIHLIISLLESPYLIKRKKEVLRRAYQVMDILRSGLSDACVILGPTPKPIARTPLNLYHYQILIKYRLEDELASTLNQVLALTQERENSELRLSIDHEPQQFL